MKMIIDQDLLTAVARDLEEDWGDGITAELNSLWRDAPGEKGLPEALSTLADIATIASALYLFKDYINNFLQSDELKTLGDKEKLRHLRDNLYKNYVKKYKESAGRVQIIVEALLKHLKLRAKDQ